MYIEVLPKYFHHRTMSTLPPTAEISKHSQSHRSKRKPKHNILKPGVATTDETCISFANFVLAGPKPEAIQESEKSMRTTGSQQSSFRHCGQFLGFSGSPAGKFTTSTSLLLQREEFCMLDGLDGFPGVTELFKVESLQALVRHLCWKSPNSGDERAIGGWVMDLTLFGWGPGSLSYLYLGLRYMQLCRAKWGPSSITALIRTNKGGELGVAAMLSVV